MAGESLALRREPFLQYRAAGAMTSPTQPPVLRRRMVGESPALRELMRQIERAAPTEASVMILGESGTGKELVARTLHELSPRCHGPFVAINCAAMTETLLESELFGHERGAFTGAVNQHKGHLEVADGGTVFLDEMGDMPLSLQMKLLRVLQEREFQRVGGTRSIRTNVRVIAATNRDLGTAIQEGKFRQDLYYRLKVISLHVPPLRARGQDILLLANYFLSQYAREARRCVSHFSDDAREWMLQYSWPGNVRELEHAIAQAVILGSAVQITLDDLKTAVMGCAAVAETVTSTSYHESVDEARRQVIRRALDASGGVCTDAAKLLGIHSVHLHRLIRSLGIQVREAL